MLDKANTDALTGTLSPTEVQGHDHQEGPFIVVSGHDLQRPGRSCWQQTAGKGVNIYTHGEMLPGHAYPELKQIPAPGRQLRRRLAETTAQGVRRQFPGCGADDHQLHPEAQRPATCGAHLHQRPGGAGPGVTHIEDGRRQDFRPSHRGGAGRLRASPRTTPSTRIILVGFGHAAVLGVAGAVIDAVKAGQIKHFFLVGGCDGAKPGRNYYTELRREDRPRTPSF